MDRFKITLLLFIISLNINCSSDSQNNSNSSQGSNIIEITNISPLSGIVGDEVLVEWETNIENINDLKVYLNDIQSDILSTSSNSLVFKVPNTSSGNIKLSINNNEKISTDIFQINAFYINNHLPISPRRGHELRLEGSGFGTNINNLTVIFKDKNNNDLIAEILNLTNTTIDLVVPVTAAKNQVLEVSKSSETINYNLTLQDVDSKIISYFCGGKFRNATFNFNNDTELIITQSSSAETNLAEMYSIAYDPVNKILFGQTHYSQGSSYTRHSILRRSTLTPSIVVENVGGTGDDSGGSIFNSNTNKKFLIREYPGSQCTFEEIDNNGVVINETNLLNYLPSNHIKYISYLNSYVDFNYSTSLQIRKIDPLTYNRTVTTITSLNYSFTPYLLGDFVICTDHSKIYIPTDYDVLEIDLDNNTSTSMGTDYRNFIINEVGDSDYYLNPHRSFYYEPTNEIIIYTTSDHTYGINLLTKKTRSITFNPLGSFSSNRVFGFITF